ncbi:MAG: hypothetical protein ABI130_10600 [Leifsonia sp.]
MTNITAEPIPVTFASEQWRVGDAGRARRRSAKSGETTRVRRGVFASENDWQSADERTRHLTRMLAIAGTRTDDLIFAGISAAAVWGLPVVGAWPATVEALAGPRSGVRSRDGVIWHHSPVPDDDIELVGPWMVTGLTRTLSDLARHTPFVVAVAALDHALKTTVISSEGTVFCGADRDELLDRVRSEPGERARVKALAAIDFADPLSGSPGESLSRVQIHRLGFAPPLLQSRVDRADGGSDYPDFEWETAYGEFDGHAKYLRAENTVGKSATHVIWDERRREDRLRMRGKAVARWTWEDAWNPPRLRSILMTAGVRPVRRPAFSPDAFGEWVVNA